MAETAPHCPAGPPPVRRPGSLRRTSTISTIWPEGLGKPMLMTGEARDLLTPVSGVPHVTATGFFEILASPLREILSITTRPDRRALQALVGERAGSNLRAHLATTIPAQKSAGTPLYLLLDDYCGASLVAGWAWSRWNPEWLQAARRSGSQSTAGRGGKMAGICTGFAPGSSALTEDGSANPHIQSATSVPPLTIEEDPLAWHEMIPQSGVGMRRARRIDVWRDNSLLHADLHFQDSATAPEGGRIAVHEYLATATADAATGKLLSLTADPRILPYRECPAAVSNIQKLLGQTLRDFRLSVLETLPGILGCTHLNDVLRSLAEVPAMAIELDG